MFGYGRKKLAKNKKIVQNTRKVRKLHSVFDVWAYNNKLYVLSERDLLGNLSQLRESILQYANDENGLLKFLDDRDKKIKGTFLSNYTDSIVECIENNQIEADKGNQIIDLARALNEKLNEFEGDVLQLVQKLGPKNIENVKNMLLNFIDKGAFEEQDIENFNLVTKGFFEKIVHGFSMWRKRNSLGEFILKYDNKNILNEINSLANRHYGIDAFFILSSRLNTIAYNDFESSMIWVKKLDESIRKIGRNIKIAEKRIKENEEEVEKFKLAVEQSLLYKREKQVVLRFIKKGV